MSLFVFLNWYLIAVVHKWMRVGHMKQKKRQAIAATTMVVDGDDIVASSGKRRRRRLGNENSSQRNNNKQQIFANGRDHNDVSTDVVMDSEDYFNRLPDECTQTIFSFLSSPRDRCSCSAVSKKWLLILAHMRGCQFNSFRVAAAKAASSSSSSCTTTTTTTTTTIDDDNDTVMFKAMDHAIEVDGEEKDEEEASRCLEAKEANDARLAAMAVGTYAMKVLGKLSVRSFPSLTQQRITDFGLQIVSQSFPNLKALSLWDCFNVGSTGLASIAKCCHALEKLDISNLPRIDDDGLVHIAKYCPNLSNLTLEKCPLVGDRSLQVIATCSYHLESISIAKCPLVGDAGVICVVSQLPRLSKVRLSQLKLSDAALHVIGKQQGSITMLFLDHLTGVTMSGFSWLGLAEKLEFLSLNSCAGLTDQVLLGNSISSSNNNNSNSNIHLITSSTSMMRPIFTCLKQVIIKKCQQLTDVGLTMLTESTNHLNTLKVESCNSITTGGLMISLRNCSRTLKVLSLVKCNGVGGITTTMSLQSPEINDLLLLGRHPLLLESLTLKNCNRVDDVFLSTMAASCTDVTHIDLIGLTSITDRGIFSIVKHATSNRSGRQVAVNLSGCGRITDWSALALARAFQGRLNSLSLVGCSGLGDRSLVVIGELCSGLAELDVSECDNMSDDGMVRLAMAARQRLEVLSLAGCHRITDRSLSCLEMMCCGLVGLNLQHCRGVTRQGVDSLRSTLWWCDLLY